MVQVVLSGGVIIFLVDTRPVIYGFLVPRVGALKWLGAL